MTTAPQTKWPWGTAAARCWTSLLAVLACLLVHASTLAQRWPDQQTNGPFQYHADFALQPYLPLLRSVSDLQFDVPRQLGLSAVQEPIHVFLFEKSRTYRSYLQTYFPEVPRRQALFVKQRGPGMVFAHLSKDIAVDLRHETSHAVLHSMLPMVPLWLDEGLGEYFELPQAARAEGHSHLKTIRWHARFGRVANLPELEALGDLAAMRGEHYRDAWAWVHFMLHGPPPATEALKAYLRDVQAHVPPGQLGQRLARAVPNLRDRYLEHFRRPTYP
jgi:hypothetical protein